MDRDADLNSKGQRRAPGRARGLASPNPNRRRCKAHKKSGEQCKNAPLLGQAVCRYHGGGTMAAREKARERILGAADVAAKYLIEFVSNPRVPYAIRLSAARDLLNRAGVTEAQTVKLGIAQPWDDLLRDLVDDVIEDADAPRALPAPDDADEEWDDGPDLAFSEPDPRASEADFPTRLNHAGHTVVAGEVVEESMYRNGRPLPTGVQEASEYDPTPQVRSSGWGIERRGDDPPPHLDPDGLARSRRRDPGAVDWGR